MDYSHGVLLSMCSPFFPALRAGLGPFLVDKTKLIENIVVNGLNGDVDLVLRPRRCGKSTMLQMLRTFFCIHQGDDPSPEQLFHNLYIASKPGICQNHMGKYPVIFFDFKDVNDGTWDGMLSSFRLRVSLLYKEWHQSLRGFLNSKEDAFCESIRLDTASVDQFRDSLYLLSLFLARRFEKRAIVLIDEYDAPFNFAYEKDFFVKANKYFGHGVLSALLKSNEYLEYAVLVGVTPTVKASGWYSGLNNIKTHALHKPNSIFAGMVMFTEPEVLRLRNLSNCELEPEDLKGHYSSYLASGHINVYNPVSIMSALEQYTIENFWIATGIFPLSGRSFPEDERALNVIENLLSNSDISFELEDSVNVNISALDLSGTLTLLYYGGYLTMTPTGRFKIPNREVMEDWARWVTGRVTGDKGHDPNIIGICVGGPVSSVEEEWPIFMEYLNPETVASAVSLKTPERTRIFHVYFLGLVPHGLRPSLRREGWEVSIGTRAGSGNLGILLISRKKNSAAIIELNSCEKREHMERYARKALQQIIDKDYRNREGLRDIHTLREYGVANHDLASCLKGRYLELDGQSRLWVEKEDPKGMSS